MENNELKKKVEQILDCNNCHFAACEQCEISYTDKQLIKKYIVEKDNVIKDIIKRLDNDIVKITNKKERCKMAFGSGNNSGFDLLNLKPHKVSTDIEGNLLIYGLPKTGKTSFAFNMWKEKCLILATERGYNYLDGAMALDITKFSDFSKILKQLRDPNVKEMFSTVVIDTVDIMEKLAVKYVCDRAGVKDLSEKPYGKLYGELDTEIENIILGIAREGYQICFISHAVTKTSMDDDQVTYTTATMSRRVNNLVAKFCDHIFYFSMERDENGDLDRWIYTRGTDTYMAGSRINGLPSKIKLDADEFKKVVSESILNIGGTKGEDTSNIPQPLFKERTFEEVMDSVVKLVTTKFMETVNMDYVKEITDRNLGIGRLISECERKDKEALEIIEIELENKAEELGL